MAIDRLAQKLNITWEEKNTFPAYVGIDRSRNIALCKPMGFMNTSGEVATAVIRYFDRDALSPEHMPHLMLMYDDLDLPFGIIKIQHGKHPKVHNGVLSCIRAFGSEEMTHVRIGTESREDLKTIPGEAYVLLPLSEPEMTDLQTSMQEVVEMLYAQITSTL
ncbi:MAG: Peptidyl-tRNA hydrolase [Microgenomates group bacterium GW2011_GWF2_45_18]|nr:MAG: Peptidyl-tRNA hydrolase [Microgenomates group bacterium GW2011_GWF1_44_10]KKU01700.1 MAG: Peptidyl-tRNA hydrolase [Microgenomates group bacterium GW2011_GWF2_45_18]